jgi:hypothetical protein
MERDNIFRTEIRWASLLLAYMSIVYVITAATANPSYYKSILDWYEIGGGWIVLQACCAVLLATGAIIKRRNCLHIGFVLSGFVWLAMYLVLHEDLEGIPGAYMFPAFGVFSFILYVEDTRRRPNPC